MPLPSSVTLCNGVTTNASSAAVKVPFSNTVVHGLITGTGAISCTATVEGSIRGTQWITIGTLSLTGTGTDSKKAQITEPWPLMRVTTSSITGTGATVSVDVAGF